MKRMVGIFCSLVMMFGICSLVWSSDIPVVNHPSDVMIIANDGYGPGDCNGNGGEGPEDGSGYGPGGCTTAAVDGAILTHDGYGPGDGNGNDGEGPEDGTGHGPGEC